MPHGSCSSSESQSTLRLALGRRPTRPTIEQTRHATLLSKFLKERDALGIVGARAHKVPVVSGQIPQISQASCHSPLVPQLPKNGQTLFVEISRSYIISLFPHDVAFVIQRSCHAVAISQLSE